MYIDLSSRGQIHSKRTHVINVEIKDNHDDAALGGQAILQLVNAVNDSKDIDEDMTDIIHQFTADHPNFPLLHTVTYF